MWRALDGRFDWLVLRAEGYEQLRPGQDGVLRSETYPGLWLDTAALLRGDGIAVRRILEQGLTSPEHAAFVAKLKSARAADA